MDVRLSKNLWRSEVACQCGCGFDSMDTETVVAFQDCCNHFSIVMDVDKVVARITSGALCFEYSRLPVSEGGPGRYGLGVSISEARNAINDFYAVGPQFTLINTR